MKNWAVLITDYGKEKSQINKQQSMYELEKSEAIDKARKMVQEILLKPTQTIHVVNPTTREELSLKEHLNEIYGHTFASEEEAIEWGKSIVS